MNRCYVFLGVGVGMTLLVGGCSSTTLLVAANQPGAVWVLGKTGIVGPADQKTTLSNIHFRDGRASEQLVVFLHGYENGVQEVVLYKGVDNYVPVELALSSPVIIFTSDPEAVTVFREGPGGSRQTLGTSPFTLKVNPPLREGEALYWEKSNYDSDT